MKGIQRSVMSRLFDMNDSTVSSSTVFMIIMSIISAILLIIPAGALIVDIIYNHTITIDLSGLATYIGASAAIATSGGLVKGWSTWSNYKYNNTNKY